jgi:hypothetical protein
MGGRTIANYILGTLTCITTISIVLLIALWQWKEIVGWILLGVLLLFATLGAAWGINEMILRHKRYQYKAETPMSQTGSPKQAQAGQYQPYHTNTYWPEQGAYIG